jgi:hypothetical protein
MDTRTIMNELTFELSGAVKDIYALSAMLKTATACMLAQQEEIVELKRQLSEIQEQIKYDSDTQTDSETDSE